MIEKKKFKISVVMAFHNTERYIAEAVESVIGQSLGFRKNIQLILVNDGSTDDSLGACQKYQETYPDNIIIVNQENQGVSSARNRGLELAEGQFVNFMDSDDKWDRRAFKELLKFARRHKEIGIFAAPVFFFGAKTGDHALNWKFAGGNAVVDIHKDFQLLQLSSASAFFRHNIIGSHRFKPELSISEDACFINELILKEGQYGLVSKAKYSYRKRSEGRSAIDEGLINKSYYLETVEHYLAHILEYSEKLYGYVPQYAKTLVLHELYYRIRRNGTEVLNDDEGKAYRKRILELLLEIDDKTLLSYKQLDVQYKLYFLSLKHGVPLDEIKERLCFGGHAISYDGVRIREYRQEGRVRVEASFVEGDLFYLEGSFFTIGREDTLRFVLHTESGEIPATILVEPNQESLSLFGDVVRYEKRFRAVMPAGSFVVGAEIAEDKVAIRVKLQYGKY